METRSIGKTPIGAAFGCMLQWRYVAMPQRSKILKSEKTHMKQKLFTRMASLLQAMQNCEKTGNEEWRLRHADRLAKLCREHLPSGSGFDSGTSLDVVVSTAEKLVFHTSFHHMDSNGFYDGWSEHAVTVRASLQHGIDVTVFGRDRNEIKEYIASCFYTLSDVMVEM